LWLQVWGMVVLGLAVRALAIGWQPAGSGLADPEIEAFPVDLNTADLATLQALPGIGRTRAEAILLHRIRHGPFRRLEDLDAVDGIGSLTREQLRPLVRPLPSRP
jgi:competence protein ComEA